MPADIAAGRSGGGTQADRVLGGGAGRPARPHRPPVPPGGGAGAGPALPGGAAGPGRAQERLAAGRGDGGAPPAGRAAPAGRGALGRGRGARRPAGLRRRAPGRPGGGAGRGRDRLPQEGDEVGRGAAPVQRDGRAAGELPGRRLPGLRRPAGAGLPRPRPVPAQELGRGRAPAGGGGGAGGGALRDQAAAGPGDAGQRAFAAGVPAAWVVGDTVYGADGRFRRWLEAEGRAYVLAVPRTHRVWRRAAAGDGPRGGGASSPPEAWARRSAGEGAQGPRWYDWAWLPLLGAAPPRRRRWGTGCWPGAA